MKGCGVMPKEKINHPKLARVLGGSVECTNDANEDMAPVPVTGDIIETNSAVVQVGWHKDAWVQVSIEADVSYFRFAAGHPDGDTSDRSTVYTPPLDREELNKLIRVLRRARDQAFGRDE